MATLSNGPLVRGRLQVIALLCISGCGDPGQRAFDDPNDAIRLVLLEHMVKHLYPGTEGYVHPICVSVAAQQRGSEPLFGGRDPTPALLAAFRRTAPGAIPGSECPEPEPEPQRLDVPTAGDIAYLLGNVAAIEDGAEVAVAYYQGPLNAGGWTCTVRKRRSWTVERCTVQWVS